MLLHKHLDDVLNSKATYVGMVLPCEGIESQIVYREEFIKDRLDTTHKMIARLEKFIKDNEIDIDKLNKKMIAVESIGSAGVEGYEVDSEFEEDLKSGKLTKHRDKNEKYCSSTYNSNLKMLQTGKEIENVDELVSYWRLILDNSLIHRDIRLIEVVVGGGGRIVHRAPKAKRVRNLLKEMFSCINGIDDKMLKAIIAHYIFVYIHPFADGNGRTTRLLQENIILSEVTNLVIPSSDAIYTYPSLYYDGLKAGKWADIIDITEFILDMLFYIQKGIEKIAEEVGYTSDLEECKEDIDKLLKIQNNYENMYTTDKYSWIKHEWLVELLLNSMISENEYNFNLYKLSNTKDVEQGELDIWHR